MPSLLGSVGFASVSISDVTMARTSSKLDPQLVTIENWLAVEPQITALAIVHRLAAIDPSSGDKQHSIVQRLLSRLPPIR